MKFDIYDGNEVVRYALGRSGAKPLIVIGVNPSSADENKPDPTIDRVEKLAKAWNFDGFVMLNLYPIRASKPKLLPRSFDKKLGEQNIDVILKQFRSVQNLVSSKNFTVWASWGDAIDSKCYLTQCLEKIVSTSADLKMEWRHYETLTKVKKNPRHPLSGRPHLITEKSVAVIFEVDEYLRQRSERRIPKP